MRTIFSRVQCKHKWTDYFTNSHFFFLIPYFEYFIQYALYFIIKSVMELNCNTRNSVKIWSCILVNWYILESCSNLQTLLSHPPEPLSTELTNHKSNGKAITYYKFGKLKKYSSILHTKPKKYYYRIFTTVLLINYLSMRM